MSQTPMTVGYDIRELLQQIIIQRGFMRVRLVSVLAVLIVPIMAFSPTTAHAGQYLSLFGGYQQNGSYTGAQSLNDNISAARQAAKEMCLSFGVRSCRELGTVSGNNCIAHGGYDNGVFYEKGSFQYLNDSFSKSYWVGLYCADGRKFERGMNWSVSK